MRIGQQSSSTTRTHFGGPEVREGCVVSIDYSVRLDSGKLVESNDGVGLIEYLHGGGQLLPALERALVGLAEGEEAEFTLSPDEAYGDRREENTATLPRSMFPEDIDLKPGVPLMARTASGHGFPLTVLSVKGQQVQVDMNHPLAGQRLSFNVTVRSVRAAGANELFYGKPREMERV